MKKALLTWLVIATACLMAAGALAADPEIVGAPKCKMCHGKKTGDQFGIWMDSRHAGAFATLGTDAAKNVAAERGLGDPQTEEACLKCHTTHAFLGREVAINAKARYEESEGVGCEACHAPGSAYRSRKIMQDREAAVAAGLNATPEATCVLCHNEESPFFEGFDYPTYYEKIKHPVPEK